jgi:hypothetical protein
MLTLAQQVSAIVTGLTDDQKMEAAGRFSSLKTLAPDDTAHLLAFFDPNITGWTRQLILTGPSCAAVLYYEDRKFHLLSSPSLVVGPDNVVFIVGHDGDSLAHTMPISIKASNAVLDVLALVFPPVVGTAALEDLMAHNTIIEAIANEDPFPFPVTEEGDVALVYVGVRVARIPSLIPLPMGHALDSVSLDNTEGIDEMIAKLMAISPTYAEWAQSIVYTGKHFEGKSLGVETLAVPEIYFDGIDFTALLRGSINTKSSRVDVSSTEGKAVLTRIEVAKKTNMETWFANNQEVYQALLSAITPQVNALMHAAPAAVSPQAIVKTQTRADKQEEVRVMKGATVNSMILVREDDNVEGAPILLIGELDESFEDTLSETPRNACKDYVQLFRSKIEHMRDSPAAGSGAMAYVMRFPLAAINIAFSSALQKGQWSDQPIQAEGLLLGQNLGLLSFAPSRTGSADYKRQWEETNMVFDEDMVETDKSHRTKVGTKLFNAGLLTSHNHLMTTIANLYAVIQVMDKQGQTSESLLAIHLREIFFLLSQTTVRDWIDRFAVRNGVGEHLPYAIALEIHSSIVQLVLFATKPEWLRKAMRGEEIPANALVYYKATHREMIHRINMACTSDSLGHYASPPSTWISPRDKDKDSPAKKSPKTGDSVSPGGRTGDHGRSTTPRSSVPTGSNPAFGMINAPPNIQHGPQLSNGQKVCLPFLRKGDSCTLGRNCPNAHCTTRYITQPDLVIIDNWVNRTTGASWSPRPPALDSGQTGTQSRVQFQPGTRTTNTRTQSGAGNHSPPPPTGQG